MFLIVYGATLALYSGLDLRGENGGRIPIRARTEE
jgi:hypothetical protein